MECAFCMVTVRAVLGNNKPLPNIAYRSRAIHKLMHPATVTFAHALPYAILPVSPQLAAFHAVRTTTLREHSSHFCSRCGIHPFLRTTVARLRSPPTPESSHVVTSTCMVCGQESRTSFQKGDVSSFPLVRKRKRAQPAQHVEITPATVLQPIPRPSEHQSIQSNNTSKRKKKSGLAEMLQRNRERNNAKDSPQPTAGLSAFLCTL
jgi:RNase P subunit RPR2